MMLPNIGQRLSEKMKLKSDISKYLNTINNPKDYEDTKNILNAYYFDDKKFAKIRELNKEAGTYDLIQYRIDSFNDFRENLHNKGKEVEGEELCR